MQGLTESNGNLIIVCMQYWVTGQYFSTRAEQNIKEKINTELIFM